LLVTCAVAASATAAVAQTESEIQTLRGLPGVGVVVAGLPERSTTAPNLLTLGEVQAAVEAQLREARIRVLSRGEVATTPSRPFIQLDFGFLSARGDVRVYILQITLWQAAVLKSGRESPVRTYLSANAEWTKAADTDRRLREAVKQEVSRFINAWGIANR
jgi:hypothetical protein